MTQPQTQPQPPHLATAEQALSACLAGPPDVPIDLLLDIAGARAELVDVFPPYALPTDDPSPVDLRHGLTVAIDALDQHLRVSTDVAETLRAGCVARQLRQVLEQLEPGRQDGGLA